MQKGTLSKLLAGGAIWGFIVLELIFFSIAGCYLSISDQAFTRHQNQRAISTVPMPPQNNPSSLYISRIEVSSAGIILVAGKLLQPFYGTNCLPKWRV